MGCVLFSPIGNTDPIRGCHDGSWLHICRVYRPRVCVAYLSKQMCEKEDAIEADGSRKDLYVRTIALLNAHLFGDDEGQYIRLECVRDPACTAAHSLDYFVPRFQKLLNGLHSDYPDDEILVNLSSGTAGMKGTLLALCTLLPFKVRPIQVSDPAKGKGEKETIVGRDYDVELAFELNEDNSPDFVNRASVQPLVNLALAMRVNELCRLVREGDYHTALAEAGSDSLKAHIAQKTLRAIIGAERRSCMKLDDAGRAFQTSGFKLGDTLRRRAGDSAFQCAEYLLTMQNDIRSGAFDNFMRKLTPLLTRLCELYLKKLGRDVRTNGVNGAGRWQTGRMPPEWLAILEREFGGYFNNNTFLAASNMVPLIQRYGEARAAGLAGMLRDVEEKVRNSMAHNIVPFDRRTIEAALARTMLKTPEALERALREFLELIQPFEPAYWASYDSMNEYICKLLKEDAQRMDAGA